MFQLPRCSIAARLLLACSVLSAVVLLKPLPASAAPIQITYTVTGGSFDSTLPSEIISGSMTYIVPTAGTATATFVRTGVPILQSLMLTAATTAMTMTPNIYKFSLPPLNAFPNTMTLITKHTANYARLQGLFTGTGSAPNARLAHKNPYTDMATYGYGTVTEFIHTPFSGFMTAGQHFFRTGTEVRSVVPEPGTGLLVGLGLSSLGVAGGWRRARGCARRALVA